MKQELPFAVALLAAGCLLWLYQSGSSIPKPDRGNTLASLGSHPDNLVKQAAGAGDNERQQFAASDLVPTDDGVVKPDGVALASYQDVSKPGSVTNRRIEGGPELGSTGFVHENSDPQTIALLASISRRLSASKPFGSTIRLTGNMFGRVVSATGNYYQLGQGTAKSRMELSFGTLPNAPTVFQLCDGRFVYKLRTDGPNQSFEFVDLIRVRETADEHVQGIAPTGWVATGGIASLFQHLASAFNFGPIQTFDETKVVLRGSWDENALRRIIQTAAGSGKLDATLRWDEVPPQLPHAVELVFQKESGSSDGYFPQRVSFSKFPTGDDEPPIMKPTVTLEFSPPQPMNEVADRFFVIDSSNLESVDATDRYIARIEAFEETVRAAAKSETLER